MFIKFTSMKKSFASLIILVFLLSSIQAAYAIGGLSDFTQINTDYFGDSNNGNTDDMIVYNSKIYISQYNGTTGVEVWEYDGTTWSQSNTDGFGDSGNEGTDNFIIHDSKLYVGTTGNAAGVEVWEFNGTTWSRVNTDGFGDSSNTRVNNDMVIYNTKLYGAATNSSGVEIWKYSGAGTSWSMVNTNGFGNANNLSVYDMGVYNSKLYVGTYQNGGATEIWTCTTCDGTDWTQTSTDGFGDANNTGIVKFINHDSKLYVGTVNNTTGSEIWELDVASWSQVNTNGFGDANNIYSPDGFIYDSTLYFGTDNSTTGTEIFRFDGGTTWTRVNTDGLGDSDNTEVFSTETYDSKLYIGTGGYVTGAEVWECSTCDGTDWAQVNVDGFGGGKDPWGDEENAGVGHIALLGSSLYAATGTWSYVPRAWEVHTAVTDLALTKIIDNASPEVGDTVTYTLTLANSGPDNATGVEVTDSLPAGLTYSNDTPSQGTYTSGTGIWDVGSLNNGISATLAISATVTADVDDTVSNSAETTAAVEADPDSTVNNDIAAEDDQDSADFTVIASTSADLAITSMTIDNPGPSTGDTVTYTLKVKNYGPDTATNIQVTNTLPANISYGNTVPTQGTFSTSTGIWVVGELTSGSEATLLFDAVVNASEGTLFTSSAEVTSVTEADPNSTPNNDISSENDQASAQAMVATITGGTSTYSPGGGGSSSTKEKLSGEDSEAEEEESAEEPEEEVEEEPVEEEPVEEEKPEPTEEEIKQEEDILKKATKPITEKIYTPPPAPPAYQSPPTLPAPPAPPISEDLLDKAAIGNAIEQYLQEPIPEPKEPSPSDPETIKGKITDFANKIFAKGESVSVFIDGKKKTVNNQTELEEIMAKVDFTKSDLDGDGLSDAFAVSNNLPLFQKDPDGDSHSNEKEIYCGSNPFEADELQPKVANLDRVTSGNIPAFRLCAGTPGDNYEIYLMNQETEGQTLLGEVTIGEDNRGVFVPETKISDGSYYILAKKMDEEEIHVSGFTVSDSDVPASPEIQLVTATGDDLDIGSTVRLVIEFNSEIFSFNSERYIASGTIETIGVTRSYIKGTSEPRLIVYATWQSRILGSVVISDASQGEFELEIPTDLPPGEHEILVYVEDEKNNLISSITRFIFTK